MTINDNQPLVSVVTPVYNGETYLRQCIESVLSQSYNNWEYIIVNNCSTDNTPAIVDEYAKSEPRIRVYSNTDFVDAIDNHNIALRHLSRDSKYCKVLQADDWLYPQCIEKMVSAAEENPSAGIVGAYVLWGDSVASDGLPPTTQFLPGRELGRLALKKIIYPFVNLSGLMLRSNLVRDRDPFLREKTLHTDVETYYELLQSCDFSFVHEVLSFVRKHEGSRSSTIAEKLETYRYGYLYMLVKFGPIYLGDTEFKNLLGQTLKDYYRFLAKSIGKRHGNEFWQFHRESLEGLGHPINKTKLWMLWFLSLGDKLTNKLRGLVKIK